MLAIIRGVDPLSGEFEDLEAIDDYGLAEEDLHHALAEAVETFTRYGYEEVSWVEAALA
jgi:hypothetical protein